MVRRYAIVSGKLPEDLTADLQSAVNEWSRETGWSVWWDEKYQKFRCTHEDQFREIPPAYSLYEHCVTVWSGWFERLHQ